MKYRHFIFISLCFREQCLQDNVLKIKDTMLVFSFMVSHEGRGSSVDTTCSDTIKSIWDELNKIVVSLGRDKT